MFRLCPFFRCTSFPVAAGAFRIGLLSYVKSVLGDCTYLPAATAAAVVALNALYSPRYHLHMWTTRWGRAQVICPIQLRSGSVLRNEAADWEIDERQGIFDMFLFPRNEVEEQEVEAMIEILPCLERQLVRKYSQFPGIATAREDIWFARPSDWLTAERPCFIDGICYMRH